MLAADLNVAGFGFNAGGVRFRGCVLRRRLRHRLRFRRWWGRFEWFYTGNVTSVGLSQLPAGSRDIGLESVDVSPTLAFVGSVARERRP